MLGLIAAFVLALATVALLRYKIGHRRKFYDCSGLVVHNAQFDYGLIRSNVGLGHVQFGRPWYDDVIGWLQVTPGGSYWVQDPDGPQG